MTMIIDNLNFSHMYPKKNFLNNAIFMESNFLPYTQIFTNNPLYTKYINWYINNYYTFLIESNLAYIVSRVSKPVLHQHIAYYTYIFLEKIFKLSFFVYIIHVIFFITNFENYFKQLKSINYLAKLFVLNATEKEVGPLDDYFFFAILFVLTISLFVFSSILLLIIHSSIFIWAVGSFFLLTFLILTIPTSLFIDFGIVFSVAIKGSASGNNFIKELLFDVISTTTVFIRFVIQNIRFFFIFAGMFELLEWVFTNNSALFVSSNYLTTNIFFNETAKSSFFSISHFNFVFVNTILTVIFYFYYILHLLFLLLVQITIYVGISIWLFFFLYSTKFLTKYEKFFISKK